jgi:ABC-2 type transport system ATP-binding protein
VFKVEGLRKTFGEIRAVDDVSFETRPGEIYGLLGPNGAGKTTVMSMMSGLLQPDAGRILFDGVDLSADPIGVKRRIGVVPQETALYEDLSARENLRFWCGLYGLSGKERDDAVERVLGRVELTQRAKDTVSNYSGGMKRRLNLAIGLVHGPGTVLMDEPTVGIDPQARASILELVREIVAAGTTVLYTTHYLEEAETLCDRIGIMDHGRILTEGTLDELKKQAGEEETVTVEGTFDIDSARALLDGVPGVRVISADPGRVVLATGGDGSAAVQLLSTVFGGGLVVDGISIRPPSLNSLFLNLTGRELRD